MRKSSFFSAQSSWCLPLLCAAATYKYAYSYYIFCIPLLRPFWEVLYKVITMGMFFLFFPMTVKLLCNVKKKEFRGLLCTLFIPIAVVLNILYVMLSSGEFGILSRGYYLALAEGTSDATGFYFAQINTWFGNIAVVLAIAFYGIRKKDIWNSVLAVFGVLLLPILLLFVFKTSYIGMRESNFEEQGLVFGGGLWNIGVVGTCSVSFLGFCMGEEVPKEPSKGASKGQRIFVWFGILCFLFAGFAGLSRTFLLVVGFSLAYYFLMVKKDKRWLSGVTFLIVAAVLFGVVEWDMILSLLKRFTDNTSGTENIRFDLWRSYLSHFDEVWLFGSPLGNVYNYYGEVDRFGRHYLPHSAPINFLVRFGLMAFLSYLFLIRNSFLRVRKRNEVQRKKAVCLEAGCIAYVTLAFINQTGYGESIFYVMFGLLLAYTAVENRESMIQKAEEKVQICELGSLRK